MITEFVTDFSEYLNQNGYAITQTQTGRFLEMMREDDFTDFQSVLPVMQTVFAKSREEYRDLKEHFVRYLGLSDVERTLERYRNEEQESESSFQKLMSKRAEQKSTLTDMLNKETQKITENFTPLQLHLTKAELKFVKDNKSKILKTKLLSKDLLKRALVNQELDSINDYSEKDFKRFQEEILKKSEQALQKGKVDDFRFFKTLFDIFVKITHLDDRNARKLNKEIAQGTQEILDEIERLKQQIEKDKAERRKKQAEINRRMAELQRGRTIVKDSSREHREVFIGKNAVIANDNTILPESFDREFKKIRREDKREIHYHIKKNLLKFKTRMTRNINTAEIRHIDIMATIQEACRTGGVPMNLCFTKPKRSKSDLVLILDVSGSCKEASEMMLMFIGLLKEAFPRGCKAFAFVNTLYDISGLFDAGDIDVASQQALEMIPRRGVYSDYYRPLKSLWVERHADITKDSIVIFMGDARNNQNPKGLDYLKNICRRAKSTYFLNTERLADWGKADSLAYEYGEYARMYQVTTPREIVNFINILK